jgi:hypothetical protein
VGGGEGREGERQIKTPGRKKYFVCNLPRVGRISANDLFGIFRNRNRQNGSVVCSSVPWFMCITEIRHIVVCSLALLFMSTCVRRQCVLSVFVGTVVCEHHSSSSPPQIEGLGFSRHCLGFSSHCLWVLLN